MRSRNKLLVNAAPTPSRGAPRWVPAILAVATLACLLPFTGKALHVDDPLFLWTAERILQHPFDPYGFEVNWYGWVDPMHEVTKNPPLTSYVLAPATALWKRSEVALHLALILPAVAAVLGTHRLASTLGRRPALAALATLLAPAFLVSATGLMCDVTMLCLWVWAVALWVEGIDRGSRWPLLAGSLLASFAMLAKYFAISLVLLLAAYALLRRRPAHAWLPWLSLPAAVLVTYHLATRALYDRGLLWDAAQYAALKSAAEGGGLAARTLVGLAFTGGCLASAALLALAALQWRGRAGVATAAVALAALGVLFVAPLGPSEGSRAVVLQFALSAAAGAMLLSLAVAEWARRRDPAAALLALWVLGTFAFATLLNWTINARSLLPMAPAVAILAAGRADRTALRTAAAALTAAAVLALAVAAADARLADASRQAVRQIAAIPRGPRSVVWFQGHWGFQYYAQAAGFRPIDFEKLAIEQGDLVVTPSNNTNLFPLPEQGLELVRAVLCPGSPLVATMNPNRHAGFYSNRTGPLPFCFGPPVPEQFLVHRATIPLRGG